MILDPERRPRMQDIAAESPATMNREFPFNPNEKIPEKAWRGMVWAGEYDLHRRDRGNEIPEISENVRLLAILAEHGYLHFKGVPFTFSAYQLESLPEKKEAWLAWFESQDWEAIGHDLSYMAVRRTDGIVLPIHDRFIRAIDEHMTDIVERCAALPGQPETSGGIVLPVKELIARAIDRLKGDEVLTIDAPHAQSDDAGQRKALMRIWGEYARLALGRTMLGADVTHENGTWVKCKQVEPEKKELIRLPEVRRFISSLQ